MGELLLEIRDFDSAFRWRWVLTSADGEFLADHDVRLDTASWQYEAIADLSGYLRWHVAPDRQIEQEAEIVARVGEWIGEQVLGRVGPALVKMRPATVRVLIPGEAAQLAFLPLELGYAGGQPIAAQGVTLVMECPAEGGVARQGGAREGQRLRVLGLFSLPTGSRALNLRKERYALVGMFNQLGSVDRAVDVRVLQYGVTRRRLRDVLEEGEGWDLIHVSGHGAPGELLLEAEDGSPDPVTADELVDMLDLARDRVKLVTLSACWSAAPVLAEQRRLLRLPPQGASSAREDEPVLTGRPQAATLASTLAGQLRCAVLAMRYPVTDDFAIAFAAKLYNLLAGKGRPLGEALGIALRDPGVIANPPTGSCPALSIATPALFGARALHLRLQAPERMSAPLYGLQDLKLARFPPQPEVFVGRTAVMTSASAALAPRSGSSGVLLYGMPGGGKTVCALELAYAHEDAFESLVWFKAPDEGLDIADALAGFGLALETGLPGLQVVHLLYDATRLASFLPSLTELCERRRVLIVLDNVESLLTEDGRWRDERWGDVVAALCGHAGLGRVVLTSRRRPERLDSRMHTAPVDPLSLDEAVLLIRDLPNLGRLVRGKSSDLDPVAARSLAVRVLEVAQGHPKLLKLADAQAANPRQLRETIERASEAWHDAGGLPKGFLSTGETRAAADDYPHVLAAWTRAVAAGLRPSARELFGFLCCLEEGDRFRGLVEQLWPVIWTALGHKFAPPALSDDLAALTSSSLVQLDPTAAAPQESLKIHPGVAAEGRVAAGEALRLTTDTVVGEFWTRTAVEAEEGVSGTGSTQRLVSAAIRASRYLIRQGEYEAAEFLLEAAIERDDSRSVVASVLPMLQIVASKSGSDEGPGPGRALARARQAHNPAEAGQSFQALLEDALNRHDYRAATSYMRDLARVFFQAGQLREALRASEQALEYAKIAGLGPWTELSTESQRLQVLAVTGVETESVLAEVRRLLDRLKTLPAPEKGSELAHQWNVLEVLNSVGSVAAMKLRYWQESLDFTEEIVKSKQGRGAPGISIAKTRFNEWEPLVQLGRLEEARTLLLECREVFEQDNDIQLVGGSMVALASVESARGNGGVAIDRARDGLRYMYAAGDVEHIGRCHQLLAELISKAGEPPADAIPHYFAATMIHLAAGGTLDETFVNTVDYCIRVSGDTAALPADFSELCDQVSQVPGADLAGLLAKLQPGRGIAEQTLARLAESVRALPRAAPNWSQLLAAFDPVIAAAIAADRGDTAAGTALDHYDLSIAMPADWSELASVLRRIRSGERGPELLDGLTPAAAAIAQRTLDAFAGRVEIPGELWLAMPLGSFLFAFVACKFGDTRFTRKVRADLDWLTLNPARAKLITVLEEILTGNHRPGIISGLTDPVDRAVAITILNHIPKQV